MHISVPSYVHGRDPREAHNHMGQGEKVPVTRYSHTGQGEEHMCIGDAKGGTTIPIGTSGT